MSNGNIASGGRHTRVHTEVRSPVEAVLARVVVYVSGVIIALVALRFVLELFGANAHAAFVQLVYGLSDVFMAPFALVFGTERVAGATFEWSALLAIGVYALVAWGLVELIRAVSPRAHVETIETDKRDEADRTP